MTGDCLPAIGPDGPVAEHLEVLHPGLRGHRCLERGGERAASDGLLSLAPEGGGRADPGHFVDGGCEVGDVVEAVADRSDIGDAFRPVGDQWHMDTTFMSVLLVPTEGCVARLRPTPGVVRVAVRSADVVQVRNGLVGRLGKTVEVLHLVEHAEPPALLAGTVVGHHEHERVVKVARIAQVVEETAELGIGVLEEGGEGLL